MSSLPIGLVTFLFCDIEGNTRFWEEFPQEMKTVRTKYANLLHQKITEQGGVIYDEVGDVYQAAFATASTALQSALAIQQAISEDTTTQLNPGLRLALYTNPAQRRRQSYSSLLLNRVARFMEAGHNGQILLTAATAEQLKGTLAEGVELYDLGEHKIKDLARPEHIFQVASPELANNALPLKTLSRRPNNFPPQASAFIGRAGVIEEIVELVKAERFVILSGPGGTGKTRLSLEVAAEILQDFADGVFYVELSASEDLNTTIAERLEVAPSNLESWLQARELLLVLDNIDQSTNAKFIHNILIFSPKVKILATSRATKGLEEGQYYIVPPLKLPDPLNLPEFDLLAQNEAVKLFALWARQAKASFGLTEENATQVAEICETLEGIPLAIELAAARIRQFALNQLLVTLNWRTKLVKDEPGLSKREQTVKSTIGWSYELLEESERQLFRRLAVFEGGWQQAAAEVVTGAGNTPTPVGGRLSILVDLGLAIMFETADGQARFSMLDTIRGYALERLAESGEVEHVQQRHASYYLELSRQELSPAHFQRDHANFRAALNWWRASGNKTELEPLEKLMN